MKLPPIPKPPISLPINATISTVVYTGVDDIDPVTGNYEPIEKPITLRCCLTDQGLQGNFGQQPGLNVGQWWLTGYIISPNPLPTGIKLVGTFPGTYTNQNSGIVQSGEFTFSETPVPWDVLQSGIGTPITASFKVVGAN